MHKVQPLGVLYIILDNARYYLSKLVQEFMRENTRIEIVFSPPYSPNINIIWWLWQFFKKNITYNEYYEKFSVFMEDSMVFFQNIEKYKSELQAIMTDNFGLIGE